jgi:hypothetical protein
MGCCGNSGGCDVPIVNSHSGVLAPSKFQDLPEMRRLSKSYCISEISNAVLDFPFEYNHTLELRFNYGRGFPLSIETDAAERGVAPGLQPRRLVSHQAAIEQQSQRVIGLKATPISQRTISGSAF